MDPTEPLVRVLGRDMGRDNDTLSNSDIVIWLGVSFGPRFKPRQGLLLNCKLPDFECDKRMMIFVRKGGSLMLNDFRLASA